MKNYKYHLEKYNGRSSRHECPACHDPHSFTYYVDDGGNILDKNVGRCDHESSCGYHYTPKQYHKDHEGESAASYKPATHTRPQERRRVPVQPSYIDKEVVKKSLSYNSRFFKGLCGLFTQETLTRIMCDYYLGAAEDGGVIFWQRDIEGNVRGGKWMMYNPDTLRREKEGRKVDWVHSIMKRKGLISGEYNLCQCLFGEHLLTRYQDKIVCVVEAEKTAIICSGFCPDFVWLATGGKSNMAIDKMRVLKGRDVILYPDLDGYQEWTEKARQLTFCRSVRVSGIVKDYAADKETKPTLDIADILIESSPRFLLNQMIDDNPNIKDLTDKLGLELVEN